jgi:hypothetical protein
MDGVPSLNVMVAFWLLLITLSAVAGAFIVGAFSAFCCFASNGSDPSQRVQQGLFRLVSRMAPPGDEVPEVGIGTAEQT